jgi:hypothetical protein
MLYLFLQKKKCKNCGKLNHKDVLYCWLCGCSFEYRICASGHKNPAWVRFCLTCGKDRSLMSRPHSSKELSFTKHPTKPSTYVPGGHARQWVLGWIIVCLGVGVIWIAVLMALSL